MAQQPNHIHAKQAEWQVAAAYPEDPRKVLCWKPLIGSTGRDCLAGVPQEKVRMVNHGREKLSTVWFWWVPGGRKEVLEGEIALLEQAPRSSRA